MQVILSDRNTYSVNVDTDLYNAYVSFYALEDGISFRAYYRLGYDDLYESQDLLECVTYFQENPIEFGNDVIQILDI